MSLALKSLHILGVVLFIGNIVVSAYWKVLADRSGNYAVTRFATRLVNLTDLLFTGLGATLIVLTGHLLAEAHGGIGHNNWILGSYLLFGLSGAIWLTILVPIQFRQVKLLNSGDGQTIPNDYYRLARYWAVAGTLATLLPLPAIYLMVARAG